MCLDFGCFELSFFIDIIFFNFMHISSKLIQNLLAYNIPNYRPTWKIVILTNKQNKRLKD